MQDIRTTEILLVEDNPGDIRLTQEALKESKIKNNLSVVMDGAEAIKYLFKEGKYENIVLPDLILLDFNLPKKDGREVLAIIKNHDQLKKIPIVVLTTSNSDVDITRAYELHANCYLTKPVDFNDFITVVNAIEHFWLTMVKLPSVVY